MRSCFVPFLLLSGLVSPLDAQAAVPTRPATPSWVRCRMVCFAESEPPIAAEISVAGEGVAFDERAFAVWTSGKPGERPDLGAAWPTFDTFTRVGVGKHRLDAGSYLLSLARTRDGLELAWFEADKVLSKGVTPAMLGKQRPVARARLDEQKTAESASALTLGLERAAGERSVRLRLVYGDREWSTVLDVDAMTDEPFFQYEARGCCALRTTQAMAVVDHGRPQWTAELANAAKAQAAGQRWRLGQDWWTTLQTPRALRLGDVEVAPGVYHLSLARVAGGGHALLVHRAADAAAGKLDAFAVQQARVVATVPVQVETADVVRALRMRFVDGESGTNLEVAFGPSRFVVAAAFR